MNILSAIVDHKKEELARRKRDCRLSQLRETPHFDRKTLSLERRLQVTSPFAVIAEFKRSSPSAGILRKEVRVHDVAQDYAAHGAAAISILTDERFFGGTLHDLVKVREAVNLPILRKEFIIDDYQMFESKAYGADAVLLIASILERSQLQEFVAAGRELDLECLIELYDVREIDKLDFEHMTLIGINNRDLRTLAVDIQRSVRLAKKLPKGLTLVSESGIQSIADLKLLAGAGFHAALIGEHFMKADAPGKALSTLLKGFSR